MKLRSNQSGVSLVELLVALTVGSLLSAALVALATGQNRIVMSDEARGNARAVARGAVASLESDLRMVESTGGVVHLATDSVTVRSPYLVGVVCQASTSSLVVATMPVDSVVLAEAAPSGFAIRDHAGVYQYSDGAPNVSPNAPSPCISRGIQPIPGGQVVTVQPGSAAATTGTPLMLYQHVRYAFRPSELEAGRIGLWRSVPSSGLDEELGAPFDSTAGFRFFQAGSPTAETTPPALDQVRGIEARLFSFGNGAVAASRTPFVTSIFFRNR